MGRSKYQQEIEDAQEVLTATLEELGFDLSVGEYSLRGLVNMVCNRAESQADNLKRIWACNRNTRKKLAEVEAELAAVKRERKGVDKVLADEAVERSRLETEVQTLHIRAMGAESQVAALEGARRVDAVSIGRLQALLNRLADAFWQNDRDNLAELKKPKD